MEADGSAHFQLAKTHASSGNWSEALQEYRRAAGMGHDGAMLALAEIYDEGKAGLRDGLSALRWYTAYVEATERQIDDVRDHRRDDEPPEITINREQFVNISILLLGIAELNVGRKNLVGDGVPIDDHEARSWIERAANHGNVDAQVLLGHLIREGRGGPPDTDSALRWFERAARKGNTEAQTVAGTLLLGREGISRDIRAAHHWFLAAAVQNAPEAAALIGELYESGSGVPRDRSTARHFYAIAADGGDQMGREGLERLARTNTGFVRVCDWRDCQIRLQTNEGSLTLRSGLHMYFCPWHLPHAVEAQLLSDGSKLKVKVHRVYILAARGWLLRTNGWQRMWLLAALLFMFPATAIVVLMWPSSAQAASTERVVVALFAGLVAWTVPVVLLFVLGLTVRWIRRGFTQRGQQ